MSYFSKSEVDEILDAVEESIQDAVNLAKSQGLSKMDDESEGDAPEMAPEASSEEAPADESMGEGDMPPAEGEGDMPPAEGEGEMPPEEGMDQGEGEMPPAEGEMPPEEGMGEDALMDEGEGGELSDEELHEIYASMSPDELERHYMSIRSILRSAYAKSEPVAKSEGSVESGNNEGEELSKRERDELTGKIAELEKNNEELEKSVGTLVKAMETLAAPQRKAVTDGVQVLGKSEEVASEEPAENFAGLSKAELTDKLNAKVREAGLSKSDRDLINGYLLRGEGKEQVIKILGSN